MNEPTPEQIEEVESQLFGYRTLTLSLQSRVTELEDRLGELMTVNADEIQKCDTLQSRLNIAVIAMQRVVDLTDEGYMLWLGISHNEKLFREALAAITPTKEGK